MFSIIYEFSFTLSTDFSKDAALGRGSEVSATDALPASRSSQGTFFSYCILLVLQSECSFGRAAKKESSLLKSILSHQK